jgi:hypothetical protein
MKKDPFYTSNIKSASQSLVASIRKRENPGETIVFVPEKFLLDILKEFNTLAHQTEGDLPVESFNFRYFCSKLNETEQEEYLHKMYIISLLKGVEK